MSIVFRRHVALRIPVHQSTSLPSALIPVHQSTSLPSTALVPGAGAPTSSRHFSNWWAKYVYGLNPRNPEQAKIAELFEKDRINPLLVERDELEDFKEAYLSEVRHYKHEEEKAWDVVKTKLNMRYGRIRKRCAVEEEPEQVAAGAV